METGKDRYLLVPKLLYACMGFAFYVCHVFRPLFISAIGFTDKNQGTLLGAMQAVSFFSAFFWANVADKTGRHKLFMAIVALLGCATFFLYTVERKTVEDIGLPLDAYISMVAFLYSFFTASMQVLLDKVVLEILIARNQRTLYGRQRLFATLAYAIITLIVSILLKRTPGTSAQIDFSAIYAIVLATSILYVAAVVVFVPSDSIRIARMEQQREPQPISLDDAEQQPKIVVTSHWRRVGELLRDSQYLFFLLIIFINGFGRATFTFNSSKFWQDAGFNATSWGTTLSAFLAIAGVVLEIGIFFVSKRLLEVFGIYWMIVIAQLSMVVRIWCYALVAPEGQYVAYLFIESLKGVSFGFMHAAGVQLVLKLSPAGMEATAQAIYYGVFSGLAAIPAGPVSDHIIDVYGKGASGAGRYAAVYFFVGIISSAGLLLFFLKYALVDKVLFKFNKKK